MNETNGAEAANPGSPTSCCINNAASGGLVGGNRGTILSSSASGAVTSTGYDYGVGGLAGESSGYVRQSYAIGAVSGENYIGGLIGSAEGYVFNTYATGDVSATGGVTVYFPIIGGLIGASSAAVNQAYATGAVTAPGGRVGTTLGLQNGSTSNVYGFPMLSGQSQEIGANNGPGDATDLTTAQEDDPAAYQGFDFVNIWQSNPNGPPTLRDQP